MNIYEPVKHISCISLFIYFSFTTILQDRNCYPPRVGLTHNTWHMLNKFLLNTHTHTHIYIDIDIYIHIYIYTYIYTWSQAVIVPSLGRACWVCDFAGWLLLLLMLGSAWQW